MAEKKEFVKLWLSYESYFEAFSDVEVGRLVRAMIKYRASREEPKFNGNERFIWPAIRRDIDESLEAQEAAAAASRENGKKGGRPPKASKTNGFYENQENQTGFSETQKSHGQGQGHGQGHGHGQGQGTRDSAPARDPAVAAVMDAYMNRIDPTPSPSSMDELKGYIKTMGPECCIRAIDAALDAKKASWNYVRRVLMNKASQGVHCIADWDAVEARRESVKKGSAMQDHISAPGEVDQRVREDLERMREFMRRQHEEDGDDGGGREIAQGF